MASIKLGAIVADIKGKIAGNYFAKRKNTTILAVCGSKLTKADAGRTALQSSRNSLALVSRSWQSLIARRQLQWDSVASLLTWYSKVGVAYTPSGYQVFTQCNLNLLKCGEHTIGTPVDSVDVGNVELASVSFPGFGSLSYAYDGTLPVTKKIVIFASAPCSTGVKYPKGGYKKIYVSNAGEVGPTDITEYYISVYGIAPASGMVFFKFELIDTGSGIMEGSKLTKADAGLV